MDSIVHFEIPAKDVKRASAFYNSAFGWNMIEVPGMNYWSIITTPSNQEGRPDSPGAINGGMGEKGKTAPQEVTVTINVADIDAALANVTRLGGRMKGEKSVVGEMGIAAYFEDPEGNIIGLWQPKR